jgi:hypothetical protein
MFIMSKTTLIFYTEHHNTMKGYVRSQHKTFRYINSFNTHLVVKSFQIGFLFL